uniref:Iso-IS1 insB n=1 Tax=Escherichia coli TaxID=562 RepID=Q6YGS6_ECOLX|nr:Iso-IS1 insB [Escherichia coli]
MLPLSVNLMSCGASLATRRNNTGSGMRRTLKLAVWWLTLSGHGMMRPVGNVSPVDSFCIGMVAR